MERLRLLLIEDSVDDAFMISRTLRRAGFDLHCDRVATHSAVEAAMSDPEGYDLIVCDFCGLQLALGALFPAPQGPRQVTPIVVVSGRRESDFRAAMEQDQVAGFVSKNHLEDMPAMIASLRVPHKGLSPTI